MLQLDEFRDVLLRGDCGEDLTQLPDSSIALVVTSPPYADSRKAVYGGVHPDDYVEWFAPIAKQLLRVLKEDGSFILNIKEKVVDGERHTYVLELILALRKMGWKWTEEYIWHKRNCAPGKWPNRFRDSWERCLHFSKSKQFVMNQDAVMVPTGDWAKSRLKNLSETDQIRDPSRVGSGFGKNVSNWVGRDKAYPTNVLHLPTECNNKSHAAAFPSALPSWFIELFSNEGDLVLDPFAGSGTTLLAARALNRSFCGIELKDEYFELAQSNLEAAPPRQMTRCRHHFLTGEVQYPNS